MQEAQYFGWTILMDAVAFAFLMWPVYRIVRKAGFSVGYACSLLAVCAGLTLAGRIANLVLTVTSFAGLNSGGVDSIMMSFLLQHLSELVFSSSIVGLIPLVYFSFRQWPLQKEAAARATFS